MKLNSQVLFVSISLIFSMLFSTNVVAQTSDQNSDKDSNSTSGCATVKAGCSTDTSCRGAKTKFEEAKVITTLRSSLVFLKTEMEKSDSIAFNAKLYDVDNMVGESDDESLQIIVKEVKNIEKVFAEKLNHQISLFVLPENKAKQIQYLGKRIEGLQKLL